MKHLKILTVITGILVFGFWIKPQWAKNTNLKETVKTLETQRITLRDEIKAINAQAKSSDKTVKESLSQIPLKRDQEVLIKDLQQISNRTGFLFKAIKFSKSTNPVVKAEQTNITFSVKGRKNQILNFLSQIETNKRFLGLKNLSINYVTEKGQPLAEMNIALYTFSQEDA